jgi:hypothetical protein
MLLGSKPYYTYSFGSMGRTIDAARKTGFYQWFHMEETERHDHEPGNLVRVRPSGEKFHDLCYLDFLLSPTEEFVRMELVVKRSFVDGVDSLFAQDLVNSFLHAALPDACRRVLEDFINEINTPAAEGQTPAFEVFKGRRNRWSTQTGWSQLEFANIAVDDEQSLVVNLGPNPTAPNAKPAVVLN